MLESGCDWSGFVVHSATIDHSKLRDYEADDVLVVEDAAQLRALASEVRSRIVVLLRERAASTTELAEALGIPKGTAGHHVKVLESAGLIRIVATRRVRALTEKYYGRVARLFVLKGGDDSLPEQLQGGALAAMMLRRAAEEVVASDDEQGTSGILRVRLTAADRKRLQRRLARVTADVQRAESPEGEQHILAYGFFRTGTTLPKRGDDA